MLSRRGLDDVSFGFADGEEPDAEARLMTAHVDGITIVNVYVPNGRALDADHYQYKLRWLDRLAAHVDAVAPDGGPVIVAGDFNIAPTDVDVYDPAVFEGATHVSPPERERLQALLDRGLTDVFRHSYPDATRAFSWWDYRRGDFHEGRGMRIDLVLASAPVVDRAEWLRHRPQRPQGPAAERPRPRRRRPRRLTRPFLTLLAPARRDEVSGEPGVTPSRAARQAGNRRAAVSGPNVVAAASSAGVAGQADGDGLQIGVRAHLARQHDGRAGQLLAPRSAAAPATPVRDAAATAARAVVVWRPGRPCRCRRSAGWAAGGSRPAAPPMSARGDRWRA